MKAAYWFLTVLPLFGQGQSGSQRAMPRGMPASPAPQAQSAENTKPEERCTLEGAVQSMAGEPLKKVNLILRGANPSPGATRLTYMAVSDAAGHFLIQDVEPGNYNLSADRSGFVTQQYGAKGPSIAGTRLTLTKSQKLKDLDFKLTPQGVITGRVLDEDGDPVQNVSIQLVRSMYFRGRKQWMPSSGANTNDLGEYRIFGVAPGRYLLSATYRLNMFSMEQTVGGPTEAYAPTYYPAAAAPDMAAAIEVTPGAQLRGMDVRLQKTRTVDVRGRVTGFSPTAQMVMIRLQPKSDVYMMYMPQGMATPFNESGDFVIPNVVPGSYVITAMMSQDGKSLSARAPLEVGNAPIRGVSLQLEPGASINGRIGIEGTGTPAPNVRVSLQPHSVTMFGPGVQGGLVKEDRSFSLSNVQPDSYQIRVMGLPDGGYVKSVRFGDNDVTDAPLDLTSGVPAGELSVTIAMSAAQLTGSVQNEKNDPVTNGFVVLIPEGKRREIDTSHSTTNTDQYGNYSLKGVAPGEYRLFAFDNIDAGSYQDPEWLKPFESKGERLSIKENDQKTVQLKLVVTKDEPAR